MKNTLLFRCLAGYAAVLLSTGSAFAQASLGASPYTETFDGIGSGLPTGFSVRTGASATAPGAPVATFGTAKVLWNNTSGAFKNFASADGLTQAATAAEQDASTDRALGLRQTGSVGDPGGAFVFQIENTTGKTNFKLSFKLQSLDVASTRTATWTVDYGIGATPTAFTTVGSTATTGGATFSNNTVTIDFENKLDNQTGPVWIRIVALTATTGSSNRPSSAIDDFSLTWTAGATSSPAISVTPTTLNLGRPNIGTSSAGVPYTLSASNLTADVTVTAIAPFTVSKDNTTFAASVTFTPAELTAGLPVYVRFTPTSSGAQSGSITNSSTGANDKLVTVSGFGVDPDDNQFSFDECSGTDFDGWMAYSVTGTQTWACTTFGHDAADTEGKASKPYGVQINGYASGNKENEDWLISPALALSATQYPLFSFWSRVAFTGPGLSLRVSTNYTGSGDPHAAGVTWTDLNADFATGDTWTDTGDIDLSAYKGQTVYLAFVYTSTTTGAARWTLDDLRLRNSSTPAATILAAIPQLLDFGYQVVNTGANKSFVATLKNLTANATISSNNPDFVLSKDGTSNFVSSLTYTPAEVAQGKATVTVLFLPTVAMGTYKGTITIASAGATSATVTVMGNTIEAEKTLEVVNWNMEWFGSPDQNPANDDLQQANALKVLKALNADVFALAEVVDTVRLGTIVRQMGGYKYMVSDFGSNVTDANSADYAKAQKLAFVYRPTIVKNPTFTGLLRCTTCDDYGYWASGRFPYLMEADVTLNNVTQHINFILIHAKANVTPLAESYERRKKGAEALKAKLDADFADKNVILLGDFNDDLDKTITTGISTTASSYAAFTADATNYTALTLPLSLAGGKSTVSYNDIIDHVVVSNEMNQFYLAGSARIRTDVADLVDDYGNTTTDHYPVMTRFNTANIALPTKQQVALNRQLSVFPNPASTAVRLQLASAGTKPVRLQVSSVDGRTVVEATGTLEQINQRLNQQFGRLSSGLYIIRVTSGNKLYTQRLQKQ
ncbi:choice-of-anchor J domain-containing protein [Hymenobacter sp. BT730]|uniref:T9SS-dependent choice-of-anchor J family protein n=1 Tax=Hymenobacter sp. BT730 TaxID=3063332 RepID=UPI0026DF9093|nr:choice-of-anchor J domain-containing protein [Hymenobacter sp. BT730]